VKFLAMILAMMVGMGTEAQAADSALDLLDAPVAYTAQFYVTGERGTFHGSVWHRPGRERRDWDTADGGQAVLLERGNDSAYLLKPSGRWYVGIGLHAAASLAGGLDGMSVDRHKLRDEVVAGIRATRYRVAATAGKSGRFDGDAWFSADGILVKAAGTLTAPDGQASQVETGLSQVVLGRVDDAHFALPKGYFGMDLRSVPADRLQQAVESMKPMLEGRR
jgi:hypothetical protein